MCNDTLPRILGITTSLLPIVFGIIAYIRIKKRPTDKVINKKILTTLTIVLAVAYVFMPMIGDVGMITFILYQAIYCSYCFVIIFLKRTKSTENTVITVLALAIAIVLLHFGSIAIDSAVCSLRLKAMDNEQNISSKEDTTKEKPFRTASPEEMIEESNRRRAEVGVAPLTMNDKLNISAMRKCLDMVKDDYFGHDNPNTGFIGYQYAMDELGIDGYYSENLRGGKALDGYIGDTIRDEYDGWFASEPHRRAILEPRYTLTGAASCRHNFPDSNEWSSHLYVQHFYSPEVID